jgi:hypothetical protein
LKQQDEFTLEILLKSLIGLFKNTGNYTYYLAANDKFQDDNNQWLEATCRSTCGSPQVATPEFSKGDKEQI